jgi:hypothetical protein
MEVVLKKARIDATIAASIDKTVIEDSHEDEWGTWKPHRKTDPDNDDLYHSVAMISITL